MEQFFKLPNHTVRESQHTNGEGSEKMAELTEQKFKQLVVRFYNDTKKDVEASWHNRELPRKDAFAAEIKSHDAVFSQLENDLFTNQFQPIGRQNRRNLVYFH